MPAPPKRIAKLLADMRKNPAGVVEFPGRPGCRHALLRQAEAIGDQPPRLQDPWVGDPRINLQASGRDAKPYQIRQLLAAVERYKRLSERDRRRWLNISPTVSPGPRRTVNTLAPALEFPSLSHLADDPDAALRGVRELVADIVTDLRANNEPIPQPLADTPLFRQVHDTHTARTAPPVGARSRAGTDQLKWAGQHAIVRLDRHHVGMNWALLSTRWRQRNAAH